VAAAHAVIDERAARRALPLERQAHLGLPPERRPLIEARAEATQLERRRRLREIAAKFESSRTLAPYRLNLMFAPALAFAVGCFAPLCCPHCDAAEPLVAGRTQLGCRRCAAKA
jgi:hypothetical protein